nr:DUF4136 domain-containing protein [Polymorphobacter sp.]
MRTFSTILLSGLVVLAGCTTTSAPVTEVTRFHLGQPIPSDAITVVGGPGMNGASLEFRTYAGTMETALADAGFRPAANDGRTAYLGVLSITQESRAGVPKPSPFRIGIGGSTGGYSGGVGGGVSVPVGGTRTGDVRINTVSLQIKRRSDNSMVWEGKAVREVPADAAGASLGAAVPELTKALLANFPGVSGQTVKVK